MHTLIADCRYALRGFARAPGFTAAALLTLALGIGANTSIFSIASALVLHPLPYKDAERLVILWNRSPGLNIAEDWFSTAQYFDIKNGHHGFEQVAIAIGGNYNLTGDGEPERIGVIRVSSNLLQMLGAQPALGRLFVDDDDQPGHLTAVLSYGTWARRYGRASQTLGKSITLNGQTYQIAGVLAESFTLPREVLPTLGVAEDGEIFLSLPLPASAATNRKNEDYNVIGKLKRGVSVAQARAEMDTITARLRRDFPAVYPPNGGLTFGVVPLLEQVVGSVRLTLLVLLGSAACVLLIACANVANLLLARAFAREKEIAVRTALGAGPGRLVRQLLTESVILALLGGALGVAGAAGAVRWLQVLQPPGIPRLRDVAINGEVLLFTLGLCAATGILFGLAPALGIGRVNLYGSLKDAGRGASAAGAVWGSGSRRRRVLVIAELALSLVLLIGAGLLIRSFAQLQTVDPGFRSDGVLTLELTMNGRKYADGATVLARYRELWERFDRLPGVAASGGVTSLPLSGFFAWGPITVEGRQPPPGENFINADIRTVGGRYFEAMGIPLRRGRFFTEQDTSDQPRVIIVDEYMAAQLWPNADPIGKRIRYGDLASTAPWRTVVGVVGRVKQYMLDADGRIACYQPQTQSPSRAMFVAVKSQGDLAAVASAVKTVIHDVDPDLPVYHVRPMATWRDQSLARRRFSMVLLTLFALLALALAAVGIYGVMAYLVSQGAREIGIRIALGATPGAVVGMIVRHGMSVALAGASAGIVAALALSRLIDSLLFGVRGTDPLTFAVVAIVLLAISFMACYVPARRAARIDPMAALRAE
jgi:predicted permease